MGEGAKDDLAQSKMLSRLEKIGFLLRRNRLVDFAVVPALLMGSYIVLFADWSAALVLFLQLALCLAAAPSGRRPGACGVSVGLVMSLLAVLYPTEPHAAVLLCVLPVAAAAGWGRWGLSVGLASWYVLAGTVMEVGWPQSIAQSFIASSGWVVLLSLALFSGFAISMMRKQHQLTIEGFQRRQRRQRQEFAHDLHDTVARELTRVVLHAEQARPRYAYDVRASRDMDFMLAHSRQALNDLRTMMNMIRDDDFVPTGGFGTVTLEQTLERQIKALQQSRFSVTLLQETDLETLPGSIRAALARILQEATVNIIRHGQAGTQCSILISDAKDEIELVVANVIGDRIFTQSNKLGLVGLKDMVHAYGGSMTVIDATPRWVLQVTLPFTADTRNFQKGLT